MDPYEQCQYMCPINGVILVSIALILIACLLNRPAIHFCHRLCIKLMSRQTDDDEPYSELNNSTTTMYASSIELRAQHVACVLPPPSYPGPPEDKQPLTPAYDDLFA